MPGHDDPGPQVERRRRPSARPVRRPAPAKAIRPAGVDHDQAVGLVARAAVGERRQQARAERERRARRAGPRGGRLAGARDVQTTLGTGAESSACGRDAPDGRDQRFLPRTSTRWAVHSEPPRSIVAELPCQPHVQVIVWSPVLVLVDDVLERLVGGVAGLSGRATIHGDSCTGRATRSARWGGSIVPDWPIPLGRRDVHAGARSAAPGQSGREVVAEAARQPA